MEFSFQLCSGPASPRSTSACHWRQFLADRGFFAGADSGDVARVFMADCQGRDRGKEKRRSLSPSSSSFRRTRCLGALTRAHVHIHAGHASKERERGGRGGGMSEAMRKFRIYPAPLFPPPRRTAAAASERHPLFFPRNRSNFEELMLPRRHRVVRLVTVVEFTEADDWEISLDAIAPKTSSHNRFLILILKRTRINKHTSNLRCRSFLTNRCALSKYDQYYLIIQL